MREIVAPELGGKRSALPALVGPLLVAASLFIMLLWTWLKWPDPLTDFGRELYLAWQVSEGKTLYRDVEHFNGPLSVHFNALLFHCFSPTLQTLAYANIIIAIATVAILYSLIRQVGGPAAATACGVTFTTLFVCAQFVDTGNFNFITPYSHEVTHGLLLALVAIACCIKAIETRKLIFAAATGALLGLLWLTKLEIFLAAAVAVGAGILLRPSTDARHPLPAAPQKLLAITAGAMLLVVAVAFLLLLIPLPPGTALRGVLGGAFYIFDSQLTSLPFYRRIAGFDSPAINMGHMTASAIVIALLLLVQPVFRRNNTVKSPVALAILAVAIPPAGAWAVGPDFPWHMALRGLPLVLAGLLAHHIYLQRRHLQTPSATAWTMLLVFSFVLLAKILLATQLQHYGFALAMPAVMVVATVLVGRPIFPSPVAARDSSAWRWFGLSVVATFIVVHLIVYSHHFASKPVQVASGANAFFASAGLPGQPSRGDSLAALLDRFASIVPADATLAAVPEGAMINFLTRRPNPTPFITLQPPEYLMFGSKRITQAYIDAPPDFVVINLAVDPAEYGSRGFDVDYGKALADWIKQNYAERARFGRLILLSRR
ncbi:MAG TPA: hypothetical protein PLD59_12035 [Tepidisphaeraceae bacterium]|nr:hypothetical protein [Tepidisphaeraceae bacterium]